MCVASPQPHTFLENSDSSPTLKKLSRGARGARARLARPLKTFQPLRTIVPRGSRACAGQHSARFKHYLKSGITPMLYSYACSYKARDEARWTDSAEQIPNKHLIQFRSFNPSYRASRVSSTSRDSKAWTIFLMVSISDSARVEARAGRVQ